jgi:hypothetical protein
MFKDLKVVKIILFLILAVVIVLNQINEHKNTEFIFKPLSYQSQDVFSFLIASNNSSKNHRFKLENVTSGEVMLDSSLTVNKTYDYFNQLNLLDDGYPTTSNEIQNLSLSPGIYIANDVNPFVVSKDKKSDITVVFPVANSLLYKAEKSKRIFESTSSYVSSDRPIELDVWTKGMLPFFKGLNNKHDVNYITDLDLENASILTNTKTIILYGQLVFWSSEMIYNVEQFLTNGGRLFIVSSDLFYAKFCFDNVNNRLEVVNCNSFSSNSNSKIQSWNNIAKDSNALAIRYSFHSNYGGENKSREQVQIQEKEHAIFQGLDLAKISKDLDVGERYIGVPNVEKDSKIYLDRKMNQISILARTNCERQGEVNNIGGVFEYNKERGGKAIIIGSSDLCLKDSQSKKSVIELFNNIINYLLID